MRKPRDYDSELRALDERAAKLRARDDRRSWVMNRRERTRQLIELGGLVAKAGLVELTDDDRAVVLGALIEAASLLRGSDRDVVLQLWRRRGKRGFSDAV